MENLPTVNSDIHKLPPKYFNVISMRVLNLTSELSPFWLLLPVIFIFVFGFFLALVFTLALSEILWQYKIRVASASTSEFEVIKKLYSSELGQKLYNFGINNSKKLI